jgi:RNA polymerase sigma-70 factor, ECF subfamily
VATKSSRRMPRGAESAPSDEELACRAQQGCAASFEQLAERFQAPVLHFLRHRGAGADAEDLLQDTFLRAYANLRRYRPRWRFATWLFTIARRVSINHHRRPPVATGDAALEATPCPGREPFEIAVEKEDRQHLWDAAARILSEEEMTAMWLYYVEDLSAREIAAVLERSWVGVKTMLFRARRRLLPLLGEPANDPSVGYPKARHSSKSRLAVPEAEVPHV